MRKSVYQLQRDDFARQFREQLTLLRIHCRTFDDGSSIVGLSIAVCLRVLLHQSKSSHPLLGHLQMLQGPYFDSAGPLRSGNLLIECPLVRYIMDDSGARYLATLFQIDPRTHPRFEYQLWWNSPVIRHPDGTEFSRKELVLMIANKDGGAHVDPSIDIGYRSVAGENAFGWTFVGADGREKPMEGRPELACVRQVAHELLNSVFHFWPEFRDYSHPDPAR